MKLVTGLVLTIASLAGAHRASPSPASEADAGRVTILALAQDETPPQPTCEELCEALAEAEEALRRAQRALDSAISAWTTAVLARSAAETAHDDALLDLEYLQELADDACANGTPEECQAALDAVNTQMGVVNDRKADLDRAKADVDEAREDAEEAKEARDEAKQARDEAQAAVDEAGCECE